MKNCDSDITRKMEKAWEDSFEEVPQQLIEGSWNHFKKTISEKKPGKRSSFSRMYAAAAVLAVLIAGYSYLAFHEESVQIVNNTLGDKEVSLPDGSLVILKPGSEITYPEAFSRRGLSLQGDAFFDVVRDTLKKFEVRSGATTTTVLGTSFLIEGGVDAVEATRVTLFSGRVLVSVQGKEESWAIVPGESFLYQKGMASIEKFETILSFEAGNKFIDVNYLKMGKVLEFLSDRFEYDFEVDPDLKDKRVTLRINKSDSLGQVLKVLSIINKTNYEVNQEQKKVTILK